jgi:hypothetical protein
MICTILTGFKIRLRMNLWQTICIHTRSNVSLWSFTPSQAGEWISYLKCMKPQCKKIYCQEIKHVWKFRSLNRKHHKGKFRYQFPGWPQWSTPPAHEPLPLSPNGWIPTFFSILNCYSWWRKNYLQNPKPHSRWVMIPKPTKTNFVLVKLQWKTVSLPIVTVLAFCVQKRERRERGGHLVFNSTCWSSTLSHECEIPCEWKLPTNIVNIRKWSVWY